MRLSFLHSVEKFEWVQGLCTCRVDALVHFAAYKAVGESINKPLEYYRNNLGSTIAIGEMMLKHGVHVCLYQLSHSTCNPKEACFLQLCSDLATCSVSVEVRTVGFPQCISHNTSKENTMLMPLQVVRSVINYSTCVEAIAQPFSIQIYQLASP